MNYGTFPKEIEAHYLKSSGVPRNELETRIRELFIDLRRTERERDETLAALTATQNRSNAQLTENRNLRLAGTSETIFLVECIDEVARARAKHGHLGTDPLFSALVEETGEVARALLDNEPDAKFREELTHVVAVAIRLAVEGCSLYGRSPTPPKARDDAPP